MSRSFCGAVSRRASGAPRPAGRHPTCVDVGADRSGWLVLRGGLSLIVSGLAAGIAAGRFATRLLASALYGVDPLDPATFAGVAALLLAVGMLASYVPARRATRVDPSSVLRAE